MSTICPMSPSTAMTLKGVSTTSIGEATPASAELPLFLVDLNLGSHCELIEVDRTQDFIDLLVYLAPFATPSRLPNAETSV